MRKMIPAMTMALALSFASLTGCGQSAMADSSVELASGGVLILSVNPEIGIAYDENGKVTDVTARNDDAREIIQNCEGLNGQDARSVVTELVTEIGEAGYFVEEVEGEHRQITIEIEAGSKLPHAAFLDEVVADVRECVNANNWSVPMDVKNESDYGMTDYADTDYGPDNDGVTDYDDTDYGPNNDGVTDYDDTDYGPDNDGVTDYDDGQSNYDDGQSNYDDGQSAYDGGSDYDD